MDRDHPHAPRPDAEAASPVSSSAAAPPAVPIINAAEPAYREDPYRVTAPLREAGPVVRAVVDGLPAWLVTRFEDAQHVLTDPAFSTDPEYAGEAARAVPWTGASAVGAITRHMLRTDPPTHTRLRRLVVKAFTARRVAGMEAGIREIATRLIDALPPHAELVEGFARPLPITVITRLFGLEPHDIATFAHWVDVYLSTGEGGAQDALAALQYLTATIGELVDARVVALGGSGLAADDAGTVLDSLILARDEGDRLSRDDLRAMAFLIIAAGYETTATLLANGAAMLARDHELRRALAADPARLPVVIEEFLRFEPPVKISAAVRYAVRATRIGDAEVAAGDAVVVHYSSANRDPARYHDPDIFAPDRFADHAEGSHLAFSHGVHYCLGAPLARLEARVAFETLLARYPDFQLASSQAEAVQWRTSRLMRGPIAVPVVLAP